MEDKENREWKIKKIGYGGQRKSGVEDKENWVWRTKKMGIGRQRKWGLEVGVKCIPYNRTSHLASVSKSTSTFDAKPI